MEYNIFDQSDFSDKFLGFSGYRSIFLNGPQEAPQKTQNPPDLHGPQHMQNMDILALESLFWLLQLLNLAQNT